MNLEPCEPPFWALTGHAQTLFGYLIPSSRLPHKGKRVEIPLPDGDKLIGFITEGRSNTVVYIFHGLSGSTDSSYIHRTSILAQEKGHTVIVTNHRGCGEGLGHAELPYHSGRAEDLSAVIEVGKKLFPKKHHVAIGYSLSGNALLLLVSGGRGDVLPDAALSVNAPIHLAESAALLKTGLNRIYDAQFFLQCRKDILAGPQRGKWEKVIPRFTSMYEFDRLYTAPAGGFTDREHYYETCSTHQGLANINLPTVILTSKDDPFVPVKNYRGAKVSNQVTLHIEEYGGHMGYLSRKKTKRGDNRWLDYAVEESLKVLI